MIGPFPWDSFFFLHSQAIPYCVGLMLVVWLLHLPLKNAAVVDVAWPLGICMTSLLYCWQGNSALPRRMLLGSMVTIWALRLSLYLLFGRLLGKEEEGRYQALRKEYGKDAWWRFLLFFQAQALSCVLLALPVFLASVSPLAELTKVEEFAALLWILAMCGEIMSDWQLARFKADKRNAGKVCREGFWAWSRHPNYFFEWLIWVSYALFALPSPWGFLGALSPALIYYFVNYVTGIPPTEAQALRSRGEAYAKYQREVSAFFPLPPEESA
jgi:steroid 5-alpha reductase family enzyme